MYTFTDPSSRVGVQGSHRYETTAKKKKIWLVFLFSSLISRGMAIKKCGVRNWSSSGRGRSFFLVLILFDPPFYFFKEGNSFTQHGGGSSCNIRQMSYLFLFYSREKTKNKRKKEDSHFVWVYSVFAISHYSFVLLFLDGGTIRFFRVGGYIRSCRGGGDYSAFRSRQSIDVANVLVGRKNILPCVWRDAQRVFPPSPRHHRRTQFFCFRTEINLSLSFYINITTTKKAIIDPYTGRIGWAKEEILIFVCVCHYYLLFF